MWEGGDKKDHVLFGAEYDEFHGRLLPPLCKPEETNHDYWAPTKLDICKKKNRSSLWRKAIPVLSMADFDSTKKKVSIVT